ALFNESFPMLKRTFEKERLSSDKDDKFPLIYVITSLYTTFILEEPIHPVGSEFPGSLKVEKRKGVFLCPVKLSSKIGILPAKSSNFFNSCLNKSLYLSAIISPDK
ncbi:MAG: DUF2115 family protein, partial [Clostridia bacterium]|nr:DUF2115 family protein [Clostridia bacterium]